MQPITIIQFAVRVEAYVRTNACLYGRCLGGNLCQIIVHNTLASISLIVSKATLRPTRARNKTPALAQEWAVWSKPTLNLMHVTLTARKQRVYSKLVFNV